MIWVKIIQLLPELIRLAESILKSRDLNPEEKPVTVEEAKATAKKMREGFKEKDGKKISDAFNSL